MAAQQTGTLRVCGAYYVWPAIVGLRTLDALIAERPAKPIFSTMDEDSWDVRVDSFPEGFKVIRLENGLPNFLCVLCDIAAEP